MTIGSYIATARADAGLSQEELLKRVRSYLSRPMSQPRLSRIENDSGKEPAATELAAIFKALGLKREEWGAVVARAIEVAL